MSSDLPVRLKQYHDEAIKLVKEKGGFILRRKNEETGLPMSEFPAWLEYFQVVVGHIPIVMQMAIRNEKQAVTLPAQWPQWFDPSFVPTPGYRIPQNLGWSDESPEEQAANLEKLRTVSREIVASLQPMSRKAKPGPTDDELRARYSHVKALSEPSQ